MSHSSQILTLVLQNDDAQNTIYIIIINQAIICITFTEGFDIDS